MIEILHVRDSDGGCDHVVLVDGERVEYAMETIDPGRGHLLSEWRETTEVIRTADGLSDGFRALVVTARDEAEENTYIEDDTEESA